MPAAPDRALARAGQLALLCPLQDKPQLGAVLRSHIILFAKFLEVATPLRAVLPPRQPLVRHCAIDSRLAGWRQASCTTAPALGRAPVLVVAPGTTGVLGGGGPWVVGG